MRRMLLVVLVLFLGVCCSTAPVGEIGDKPAVYLPTPNPWHCSVEIESFFRIPDNGKLVKPSTLLMRKVDTKIVVTRGTGTIIGREGDVVTILTAKHVIHGAKDFWVKFWGVTTQGFDPKFSINDVAIFKIKEPRIAAQAIVAPLASSVPKPGTELSLVGNALGLGLKYMAPGPMGDDKPIKVMDCVVWEGSYHSYPGCSGGGIWADGKLVGVVSMVLVVRVIDLTGQMKHIPMADMGLFVGVKEVWDLLRK